MARIRRVLLSVLSIGAVAVAAALVLCPFYGAEDRPALFLGSAIAAVAGIASHSVSRIARGGEKRFAAAFLGATFLRFILSLTGLLLCPYLLSVPFNPVAMSLLLAYLVLLAVDTVTLCRAQSRAVPPPAPPVEGVQP